MLANQLGIVLVEWLGQKLANKLVRVLANWLVLLLAIEMVLLLAMQLAMNLVLLLFIFRFQQFQKQNFDITSLISSSLFDLNLTRHVSWLECWPICRFSSWF